MAIGPGNLETLKALVIAELEASGVIGDHGCRIVYSDADQSIPDNVLTEVAFADEEYDTDAYFTVGTSPTDMVIPAGQAGKYLIGCWVTFVDTTGASEITVSILKNGTDIAIQSGTLDSAVPSYVTFNTPHLLEVGDVITIGVKQNSAGAMNIAASAWLQRTA